MKLKYCPGCGSLDDFIVVKGLDTCKNCNHIGQRIEGSIEELNNFKQRLKENSNSSALTTNIFTPVDVPKNSNSQNPKTENFNSERKPIVNKEWKEKLKSLRGRKDSDCEIF